MTDGVLSHRQIVRELVKLCRQKASGTIFIGSSARLIMDQGEICWAAHGDLRGNAALESIREIDTSQVSLNPALKMIMAKQDLPPTRDILEMINSWTGPTVEQEEPAVTEVVSPDVSTEGETGVDSPSTQEPAAIDTPFIREQVLSVLEPEALEYLGPIAKVVCAGYLESMPAQLSQDQVFDVIEAVAGDIGDERKAASFRKSVNKALKIN